MYLSLVTLILPLALSVGLTASLFDDAERQERAQIALDEAGMTLGQGDRDVFRGLAAFNRMMIGLEAGHHSAHVCARIPSPIAAACEATDEALEIEIRLLHVGAGRAAQAAWALTGTEARVRLSEEDASFQVFRRQYAPVRPKVCPVCHLETGWELAAGSPLVWRLSGPDALETYVKLEGESMSPAADWTYRLHAQDPGRRLGL